MKLEDKEEKQEKSKEEGEEEKQEISKGEEDNQEMRGEEGKKKQKRRGSGCFSWVRSRQRQARKSKYIFPVCVPHLVKGC